MHPLTKTGLAVLFLFVAALIAPPAAPVQISYVVSDSMSPTIDTNDGYVLVNAETIEPGDIITYASEERSMPVTHRVVDTTADGYITKGDANPSTDQAAGYPPVQPADVSGKVLMTDGAPLRIPRLGAGIGLLQQYWYVALVVLCGGLLYSVSNSGRSRNRETLRSRELLLTVAVVAVFAGVVLISFSAVQQAAVYQVTDAETSSAQTLTVGQEQTESMTVRMTKLPATHMITETNGMNISSTTSVDGPRPAAAQDGTILAGLRARVLESEQWNVTATIPPQDTAGPHRTRLSVYSYPATLPRGVITTAHAVHPLFAALLTILAVVVPLSGLYWLFIDITVPLRGTRNRWLRRLTEEQ